MCIFIKHCKIRKSSLTKENFSWFLHYWTTANIKLVWKWDRKEGRRRRRRRRKSTRVEKTDLSPLKQFPWQGAHDLPWTRRQCPSKLPNSLHMSTLSHYYYFLHHVCWPVSYRHEGWQLKHCRPIAHCPTVISNSSFLIINIILTYSNDALNSSVGKQCALSVLCYEHSMAHKNNLTTLETNLVFQGWADDTSGPNYITGIQLHLHH